MSLSGYGTGPTRTHATDNISPGIHVQEPCEIDALWDVITTSHALAMTPTKVSVTLALSRLASAEDIHVESTGEVHNLRNFMKFKP